MATATDTKRKTLYCDCCSLEGMAYQDGNKLTIVTTRHGKRHILTLELDKISTEYNNNH